MIPFTVWFNLIFTTGRIFQQTLSNPIHDNPTLCLLILRSYFNKLSNNFFLIIDWDIIYILQNAP